MQGLELSHGTDNLNYELLILGLSWVFSLIAKISTYHFPCTKGFPLETFKTVAPCCSTRGIAAKIIFPLSRLQSRYMYSRYATQVYALFSSSFVSFTTRRILRMYQRLKEQTGTKRAQPTLIKYMLCSRAVILYDRG